MITVPGINITKMKNDGKIYLSIFNQCDISTVCYLAVPALGEGKLLLACSTH